MNRRTVLSGLMGASLVPAFAASVADAQASFDMLTDPRSSVSAPWAAWKAAFVEDDGRVVDRLQQGASHSESQGYGLLLAALFGDGPTFDRIYQWTETNLAVRSDALLAWRWLPGGNGRVPDRNNASDGDLFYAWALVIRGQRDAMPALLERAQAIAMDLVDKCIAPAPDGSGRLLLLPAAEGFVLEEAVIVNPSYYMPRAMREVARVTGASDLSVCATDGEQLMADLAGMGLMPDWIEVGVNGISTVESMSDRNGYEAVRVALFLIWSGNAPHPAVLRQAQAYRQAREGDAFIPGQFAIVMERFSGRVVETSADVGYGAVAAFTRCASSPEFGAPIPFFQTSGQPYYPATLHLMTLIAQIVSVPECVPI